MFGMITRSRAFALSSLQVFNNVAKQQFVVTINDLEATLGYEQEGKNIVWHTTDVPDEFQGKGVGKLLAQHACDHAVNNNLNVTCKCHFLANYYERNSDKYKKLKIKLELEE